MSPKFNYFNVTTVTTVKAKNKTDAGQIARGRRGVPGTTLDESVIVDRISATEANSLTATA